MKAQVLYGIGNIKYTDIEAPRPKAGEALIRVSRCGICGSDVPRVFKTGAHNMPLVPGHEFTGTVEECVLVPELVGKKVGVFPLIPCMECEQCENEYYEMCSNYNYLGSRCDGGFAEYVSVPVWNLFPLPDEVTDDEAAMLEPMCVAVHAMRRAEIDSDSNPAVVVCGLGTIGLLMAMFLKDAGFSKVLFVGNKDIQKKMLLEMGYSESEYCDVRYGDPTAFIKDKTYGKGADIYFECIGRSESYVQAVNCTAPLGKVILVGNPASDMELPRDAYWKILRNQFTLKGTWNSSYCGPKPIEYRNGNSDAAADLIEMDDWDYVIDRLVYWKKTGCISASGKLMTEKGHDHFAMFFPERLITHRYSLEDMQEGLRIMQKKSEEYIKIMIEIGKVFG